MAGKIVLFGATGYTGELTARELVRRGARPLLAARTEPRVSALAEDLGQLEWAVASVTSPASIEALLEPGDVLVTTVGPFTEMGEAAFGAALRAGAHYVDSTGEPAWIRSIFERTSELESAGVVAIPAFGYDYVPGNLAAGLALDAAGDEATAVDVGYFAKGPVKASGGTLASLGGAMLAPGYEFSSGQLRTARAAKSERSFDTSAGPRTGISIGGSELLALPLLAPQLREISVYLGMVGGSTAPIRYGSAALAGLTKVPGARSALNWGLRKALPGSTGGPSRSERDRTTAIAVADVFDTSGTLLSHVELNGPNPYDLTASFLAWAGMSLSETAPLALGAQGPVSAFGLEALAACCESAGLVPVSA